VRSTLAVLAMPLITPAGHAQEKKPWNVDRICGRVEHVRRIPIKKQPDNYTEKRKGLRGVPLELYESNEGSSCGEHLKSVGAMISGKAGQFDFKPEQAGHYWLTAKWNGRDYKVAVVFVPQEKSSTICSLPGIQIEDEGDASWWLTVAVD
jgi:hypothetical protein